MLIFFIIKISSIFTTLFLIYLGKYLTLNKYFMTLTDFPVDLSDLMCYLFRQQIL